MSRTTSQSKKVPNDFYEKLGPAIFRQIGRELALAYRVLDLGCGGCDLAAFLRRAYRQRVTGVDISDGKLPRHDDPRTSRAAMRCIKGNACRLAFLRNASEDAVVATWALHEMENRLDAVTEAYRVLRPGGKILIVDFPKGSLAQRLWNEDYLTPSEAATLLKEAGFARVRARTIHKGQVMWLVGFRPPNTVTSK